MHESHADHHKKGHVVGGRQFGYTNKDVFSGVDLHGRPLRSHVERVINPAEAKVVRRIFELYDSGHGLKRIAKLLRQEKALFPQPFKRKDGLAPMGGGPPPRCAGCSRARRIRGSWCGTRPKLDKWNTYEPTDRPEKEWQVYRDESLRIIDEPLWKRAESRRSTFEGRALRFEDGRMSGRPPKHATQNLLAGLATCALCGGGLVVETGGKKRGRKPEYICHRHRVNGSCTNTLRVSVAEMNEAVLQAVEEHALTPEAIAQVIALTERDDAHEQRAALEREWKDNTTRLKRITDALEVGGDVKSLVVRSRELEARQRVIEDEMRGVQPVPRLAPAVVKNRLAEWRRLLRASTMQGRAVLQRLLDGRLTFTPRADGQGYDFGGPTRFDKLFTGIVVPRPAFITGNGGTTHIGPEDTFDGDYGRLLETALKGKCARRDSNPRPTASKAGALSN